MAWYYAFITCWAALVAVVVYRLMRSDAGRREQFRGTTYGPLVAFLAAAAVFTAVVGAAILIRR